MRPQQEPALYKYLTMAHVYDAVTDYPPVSTKNPANPGHTASVQLCTVGHESPWPQCPVRSAQGGRGDVFCLRQWSSPLRSVPGLAHYWGVVALSVPSTDTTGETAFVSCAICLEGLSQILGPWLWAPGAGAASGSDSFPWLEQPLHPSLYGAEAARIRCSRPLALLTPLLTPVRADQCGS